MTDIFDRVMLRRWTLDLSTGQKVCIDDPVDMEKISADDRMAIEAKNADIHGAIAEVEAYETDPDLIVDDEVMALARLRRGEPTDADLEIITIEWGYTVDIDT